MKDMIVKRKLDGSLAIITHWKHFHVNRETGSTIAEAFTIKYLNGMNKGISSVWPMSFLQHSFEVVGKNEEQRA